MAALLTACPTDCPQHTEKAGTASDLLLLHQMVAFAPQAVMMFKVFGRQDTGQWKAVDLGLLSPQGRLPVQLDEQGRFVLRDEWRQLDTDTELRSRLMDGKVTWRPDVRTPGSSAHLRRLGDLRLQCRASFFSGVARSGIAGTFLGSVLKPLVNGCDSKLNAWSSFADAPVFGIRLVHGDRALHLSQSMVGGLRDPAGSSFDWGYALRHQLFRLPMGDERWPDDARVEFELVSDPQSPVDDALLQAPGALSAVARSLQPGIAWDELKPKLGRDAGMVRYDHSGLRVVRYLQEQLPEFKQSLELVLLLDEQDRLVKFALRAMGEQRLAQAVPDPWSSKPASP